MGTRDPRIDAYIDRSADFAKPILAHVREVVHAACPDVEETIKWGFPNFTYDGAILCSMAAFKQHCSFGFWNHAQVVGGETPKEAMGSFGRITAIADLPSRKALVAYIKKAMTLRAEGVKRPKRKPAKKAPLEVPAAFAAALQKNRKAAAAFEAFPPSHKREYVEWIAEAKRDETRDRRIAQAVEWIAEGKPRNWKYM